MGDEYLSVDESAQRLSMPRQFVQRCIDGGLLGTVARPDGSVGIEPAAIEELDQRLRALFSDAAEPLPSDFPDSTGGSCIDPLG